MADFLTGLLNRTQGTEVTLQRRHPSLFEPNSTLLTVRGDTSELSSGESDHEQINTSVRRDNGFIDPASIDVPGQSAPYTKPNKPIEAASSTDVSSRLPEQQTVGTQFSYNKPEIANGNDIHHTERVQTIREIHVEKYTRPAEPNTADPRSDSMTERLIERIVPMTPLPLQRIETIREIQIEKPIIRSLADNENTSVVFPKNTLSAEPAVIAPATLKPQAGQERVVQTEVRITPLQAPKIDVLSPKPKEQIVRDMAAMPVSGVGHSARRESANFAEAQHVTEAAPTIQVTIGRIEVRATQQPASPSVREAKPSTPRLSLEDYLRQRNGGGR